MWTFATAPLMPPRTPLPECPDWDAEMTNRQLADKLELCRAALAAANARVALWETWTDNELDAQRDGTNRGSD